MECKIFSAINRNDLQDKVNAWLQTHLVSPESMHFQLTTISIEDADSYKLEHTLILFYVPLRMI